MQPNSNIALAVRRALILGLVPASMTPALAQEAATAESLETVVVTGSRLKQANLESSSPITQVTAADITTQGVTRIEDLINQLPQAFAAQNATVSNGSTGTATVNLRGDKVDGTVGVPGTGLSYRQRLANRGCASVFALGTTLAGATWLWFA